MVTASGPGGAATTTAYVSLSQVEARATAGSLNSSSDYCGQTRCGPRQREQLCGVHDLRRHDLRVDRDVAAAGLGWGYPGTDAWAGFVRAPPRRAPPNQHHPSRGGQRNLVRRTESHPHDAGESGARPSRRSLPAREDAKAQVRGAPSRLARHRAVRSRPLPTPPQLPTQHLGVDVHRGHCKWRQSTSDSPESRDVKRRRRAYTSTPGRPSQLRARAGRPP